MPRLTRFALPLALLALSGCIGLPGARPVAGLIKAPAALPGGTPVTTTATLPTTLDNDCMFVSVTFRRPDGSTRPALACRWAASRSASNPAPC